MIVYAQPGYAIDWNWATQLTVWSTHPDSADRLVATHRLDRRPRTEREATAAARRWWRNDGQAAVQAEQRT